MVTIANEDRLLQGDWTETQETQVMKIDRLSIVMYRIVRYFYVLSQKGL